MEFLVQTEQKLAVEISGNYQHLLEQQRAHEVSCADRFGVNNIGLWKTLQNPAGGIKVFYLVLSLLKCMIVFAFFPKAEVFMASL